MILNNNKKSFGSDNCILVNLRFSEGGFWIVSASCVSLLAMQISSRNPSQTGIQTEVSALTWRLYRNWKLLGLPAALSTAWASSMQPRPPWAQWWHGTASDAPHSFAILHTRSISAWVSVLSIKQWKQCYWMYVIQITVFKNEMWSKLCLIRPIYPTILKNLIITRFPELQDY